MPTIESLIIVIEMKSRMEIQCLAQNLLPHDHQQQVPWLIVRKLATGAEEPKAVDPVPVRRLYSDYDYAVNEAGRAAVKDTGAAPGPVVDPAVVDPIDYAVGYYDSVDQEAAAEPVVYP